MRCACDWQSVIRYIGLLGGVFAHALARVDFKVGQLDSGVRSGSRYRRTEGRCLGVPRPLTIPCFEPPLGVLLEYIRPQSVDLDLVMCFCRAVVLYRFLMARVSNAVGRDSFITSTENCVTASVFDAVKKKEKRKTAEK